MEDHGGDLGGDRTIVSVRRVGHDEWWIRFDPHGLRDLVETVVRGVRAGRSNRSATNAFRRWSPEDDARLKERFGAGAPIDELAAVLRRKEGAIRARLVKLGLLAPEEAPGMRVRPMKER
jgi:hypothetical protein